MSNLRDHGVSFEEAATVLDADGALDLPDASKSGRTNTIGFSSTARVLFVVTTETTSRTRIISARPATPAERRKFTKRGK